jgi:hypothetical protein
MIFTNITLAQEPVWDPNKINLQSEQLAGVCLSISTKMQKELEKSGTACHRWRYF